MKKLILIGCLCLFSCQKQKLSERHFKLAVTTWQYDFTKAAEVETYQFISNHCDAISHHFDDGIPWDEALNEKPWPTELQKVLATKIEKAPVNHQVLLSVAALDISRKKRAGLYQNKGTWPSEDWQRRAWNDSQLITAYARFVTRLADTLNADYINFGVESNLGTWDEAQFESYKEFLKAVYAQLKQHFPTTPIFISNMVVPDAGFFEHAQSLRGIGDWTGLSCYPYSSIGSTQLGSTDPDLMEKNLLEIYINLSNRPWCMAETGFIAEDLKMPQQGISKRGTPEWQWKYLNKVFQLASNSDCKLIVWFCHRDYDYGTKTLKAVGAYTELFSLWQDTGFENEDGQKRPAYSLWNSTLERPFK